VFSCNARLGGKNSEQSLISIKVGGSRKRYGEILAQASAAAGRRMQLRE
jgi:hypothetical protein